MPSLYSGKVNSPSTRQKAPVAGVRRVEMMLRQGGATVLAATALTVSPWLVFALIYKTYNFIRFGKWYFIGAPTPIGMFNRVALYLFVTGIVVGVTMLAAAALLRCRKGHHQRGQ